MARLQRDAGNQAVNSLLRAVPSPTARTAPIVVQRVGGLKIGFELDPPPVSQQVIDGQTLLLDCWKQVRKDIHDNKVGAQKDLIERAAAVMINKRDRQTYLDKQRADPTAHPVPVDVKIPELHLPPNYQLRGFSQFYANELTRLNRDRQMNALVNAGPFKQGRLTLKDGSLAYRAVKGIPYVQIGTLKQGSDAFEPMTGPEAAMVTARPVLTKKGITTSHQNDAKQYVHDSRGVLTRRFAYVEKNYYQMMEFFMVHKHEGRFQAYMRAAGDAAPDMYEHRDPAVDLVIPGDTRVPDQKLTKEQMAVAHQKLGSGPQQRGVSLTSTPKIGATYVNTGENFRTKRGFRLKIDLSKIPPDTAPGPLLINHYGGGGVVDDATGYDTRRSTVAAGGTYPYKASSIHARELFLEYLRPEWIVEIEHHPDDKAVGTTLAASDSVDSVTLFEQAKIQFGGDEYEAGFDFGLKNAALTGISLDKNYAEGFDGARQFVSGWKEGSKEYLLADRAAERAKRSRDRLTPAQFVYDQTMSKAEHADKYDLFRLGYLRGRAGKAMIKNHESLASLHT